MIPARPPALVSWEEKGRPVNRRHPSSLEMQRTALDEKRPPHFFRVANSAKKLRRNLTGVSGRSEIESFSKRDRVVLKAEIESFSKCPHTRAKAGGPGRTRTCNQTVMSGRL